MPRRPRREARGKGQDRTGQDREKGRSIGDSSRFIFVWSGRSTGTCRESRHRHAADDVCKNLLAVVGQEAYAEAWAFMLDVLLLAMHMESSFHVAQLL
mmetsp:Transcript_50829/g.109978  ORF Transcript_50829/g.109978 Transcript_50829/m.109978 type:complete len:98 (-) Transcript_50829:1430-1723(-)